MKTMLTTLVLVTAVAFGQLATADGGMVQGQMMMQQTLEHEAAVEQDTSE